MNLLVNAPSGEQQIVSIDQSGGYFDPERVIWDERVDGPLPDVTIGGLVRLENELVFDHSRQDEHNAAIAVTPDPKLVGVEILGVMCSATRDDQNGLSAVALGVTLARSSQTLFPSTRFEFENGNELIISDENFDHVYSIWVPFRQSFFAAT